MYRIIWRHFAVDQLMWIYTEVFERGGDTAAVNEAAAEIDRRLSQRPAERGESRGPHDRVDFFGPLTVVFEVYEEEQTVFILSVRRRNPRRS